MRTMKMRILVTAVVLLGMVCKSGQARQSQQWPYDKLFKTADLIVVAKMVSEVDAKDDIRERPPYDNFLGVLTSFEVRHVIKGEFKDKKLVLLHYRLKKRENIIDGPNLISFCQNTRSFTRNGREREAVEHEYMLFLKKRSDGRYECVTGQFDSRFSVRQVTEPPTGR